MDTLQEAFDKARKKLSEAGISEASFNAAKIIEKHTGFKRHEIVLFGERPFGGVSEDFWRDVERRAKHEPLQYICGKWPFFDLDFFVGQGVLIPRPDTEILCETAIPFLAERKSPKLLDLCAGSGCISISIVKNTAECEAICVELSDAAISYLQKNIDYHRVSNRVSVIQGDMLKRETADNLPDDFDMIICNPPYIVSDDIASLDPEVVKYEPLMALDGGKDGLMFYKSAGIYLSHLKPGGLALFEVGLGQAADVSSILQHQGYSDIFVKKDYAGIERMVAGYRMPDK